MDVPQGFLFRLSIMKYIRLWASIQLSWRKCENIYLSRCSHRLNYLVDVPAELYKVYVLRFTCKIKEFKDLLLI